MTTESQDNNKGTFRVVQPTPAPLSADSLRETLEKALIDCYEQGLEHGHAAEAGVLPTQEHRELIILNAENEILVALQAERQQIADSLPEKRLTYLGITDDMTTGFNQAIEAVRDILTTEADSGQTDMEGRQ